MIRVMVLIYFLYIHIIFYENYMIECLESRLNVNKIKKDCYFCRNKSVKIHMAVRSLEIR